MYKNKTLLAYTADPTMYVKGALILEGRAQGNFGYDI